MLVTRVYIANCMTNTSHLCYDTCAEGSESGVIETLPCKPPPASSWQSSSASADLGPEKAQPRELLRAARLQNEIAPENQGKFLRVRRGCQASQRKGWPLGKSGKLPGKSGELPGKSGKLPGNPWIAVKFHSERTSGEVAEKLPGKFGALPGKSGDFPEARGFLTPSQRLAKFVSKKKIKSTRKMVWKARKRSEKWSETCPKMLSASHAV